MKFRRRKCRCCGQWYMPQPHNAYHQRYCTEPECRRASHRSSHRRWLRKNPDQHRGPENAMRVNEWRAEHPDYGHNLPRYRRLRFDVFMPKRLGRKGAFRLRAENLRTGALRDLYLPQVPCPATLAASLDAALRDLIGNLLIPCYC